jgi:hypothetical protein
MTRARATTHRRRRSREWLGVVLAFVVAALAGLLAARFGTHRAWEQAPSVVSTSSSVPFVDPQRIP